MGRNLVPNFAKMGRILVSFCMKWDVISSHFLRFGTRLRPGFGGFRDEITSHLGVNGTKTRLVLGKSDYSIKCLKNESDTRKIMEMVVAGNMYHFRPAKSFDFEAGSGVRFRSP